MYNPIGVLDSGIGGLTVLKELVTILPHEDIIYYGDSKYNPYGDKEETELLTRIEELVEFFLEKKCKAIVFACNTATTKTLSKIKKKYRDVLFIGVTPAIKLSIDLKKKEHQNGDILVMATEGTIGSKHLNKEYRKYQKEHTIWLLPCRGLADLIEQGKKEAIASYLQNTLGPYQKKNISYVVLGCTHYPLIKDQIMKYFNGAKVVDSHRFMCETLKKELYRRNLLNDKALKGKRIFYNSKSKEKEKRCQTILAKLLKEN